LIMMRKKKTLSTPLKSNKRKEKLTII